MLKHSGFSANYGFSHSFKGSIITICASILIDNVCKLSFPGIFFNTVHIDCPFSITSASEKIIYSARF